MLNITYSPASDAIPPVFPLLIRLHPWPVLLSLPLSKPYFVSDVSFCPVVAPSPLVFPGAVAPSVPLAFGDSFGWLALRLRISLLAASNWRSFRSEERRVGKDCRAWGRGDGSYTVH